MLFLSFALIFSCGKESKSPTSPPLKDNYTISGTVTGADSVTVTLSGDAFANWTVNSGGTYSFDVATFGTYTVTPSKSGYVFTPPSKTAENLGANCVQSFNAIPLFTLSGTITGVDGATVTLSGDATDA